MEEEVGFLLFRPPTRTRITAVQVEATQSDSLKTLRRAAKMRYDVNCPN